MCLDKKFNETKTEKILKKLPETVVVYKVVEKNKKSKIYHPYFWWRRPYKEGVNKAEIVNKEDGFYSFKSLIGTFFARIFYFNKENSTIIKCKINKEDIIQIGRDRCALTFVTSKIIIPKYKGK